MNIKMHCNAFSPSLYSNSQGVWVQANTYMPDIGSCNGNGDTPGGNDWPLVEEPLFPTFPLNDANGYKSPDKWFSIFNEGDNWNYFPFENEFVGSVKNITEPWFWADRFATFPQACVDMDGTDLDDNPLCPINSFDYPALIVIINGNEDNETEQIYPDNSKANDKSYTLSGIIEEGYPNPTRELFYVPVTKQIKSETKLVVKELGSGKLVIENKISPLEGETKLIKIDVSGLSNGMYFYYLSSNNEQSKYYKFCVRK